MQAFPAYNFPGILMFHSTYVHEKSFTNSQVHLLLNNTVAFVSDLYTDTLFSTGEIYRLVHTHL